MTRGSVTTRQLKAMVGWWSAHPLGMVLADNSVALERASDTNASSAGRDTQIEAALEHHGEKAGSDVSSSSALDKA